MGGMPDQSLKQMGKEVLHTGGPYNSSKGCIPYQIPPVSQFVDNPFQAQISENIHPSYELTICPKQCYNKGESYEKSY